MVNDMTEGGSSLVEEARQELAEQRSIEEPGETPTSRRRKAPAMPSASGEPAMGSTG